MDGHLKHNKEKAQAPEEPDTLRPSPESIRIKLKEEIDPVSTYHSF
jgi:hypothetical protein